MSECRTLTYILGDAFICSHTKLCAKRYEHIYCVGRCNGCR